MCRVIVGHAYTNNDDAPSLPKLTHRYRKALEKFGKGLLRHSRVRHLVPHDALRRVHGYATSSHGPIPP
ncbi:hypothetical protein E2C01_058264 [Portunus trituberculatus]|uniref:Uncharacterized protein n=1 Tax=Portunus trituberculatus TaxID=210409 RepID=A0A5B7GZD3_PORTR|nr:hypothetical protein [Portunus trituberculatus]